MQTTPEPPQQRRFCHECGSANPPDATHCVSCGALLSSAPEPDTIIDISDGTPEIIGQQPEGQQTVFGRRIVDIRSTNRTCLVAVLIFIVLVCCACWVLAEIPQRLF